MVPKFVLLNCVFVCGVESLIANLLIYVHDVSAFRYA